MMRERSPLMEGVKGKYRSPWREIEVGKVPTVQICGGEVGDEGAGAPSWKGPGRRLLQIEDGSWGKKEEDPVFPQGPPYIGRGAPPEVPVDWKFRVRLTGSSADA